MPKFAADLDALFGELPFLDRFAAAEEAGYGGVVFRSPYSYPVEQIAHRLCRHGLQLVQHGLPPGCGDVDGSGAPMASGNRAMLAGLDLAVRYARALGVHQLSCALPPVPADAWPLASAAAILKQHRLDLLAVPQGCGGAYAQVAAMREGGMDNLYLQYWLESGPTTVGGNDGAWGADRTSRFLADRLPLVRHIQLGGGCGQGYGPDPGCASSWPSWLDMLDRLGYQGWVGCCSLPASILTSEQELR
jgi:hydroxypyruvate isomerase